MTARVRRVKFGMFLAPFHLADSSCPTKARHDLGARDRAVHGP